MIILAQKLGNINGCLLLFVRQIASFLGRHIIINVFAVLLAIVAAKGLYFYTAAAGGTSTIDCRNKGSTVTLPGGKDAAAGAAFLAATAVVALVAASFTPVHLDIDVVAVNGAVVLADEMWRAAQAMETAATDAVAVATGGAVFGRFVLA